MPNVTKLHKNNFTRHGHSVLVLPQRIEDANKHKKLLSQTIKSK